MDQQQPQETIADESGFKTGVLATLARITAFKKIGNLRLNSSSF